MNFIDLTTKEDVELRSRDILLESGFIYLMGITGANGMPVELCSDDALESGECQRGFYFIFIFIFFFFFFFFFLIQNFRGALGG